MLNDQQVEIICNRGQEENLKIDDKKTVKRARNDSISVSLPSFAFELEYESTGNLAYDDEESTVNNIISNYKNLLMQISDTYTNNKKECNEIQRLNDHELGEFNKDACYEKLLTRFNKRRAKERFKIIKLINSMETIDENTKDELIWKIVERKYD